MFDIGVNLTSSQFAKDRDDVVARAFDAGVNGLLITGTNLRESQQAQKLARQYSSCWSTAGVHPHAETIIPAQRASPSGPYFATYCALAWRRCRMAGCHHGCQCQNTVWDCVLEFAELGVLHTVLNLFIDKIK